MSILLLGGTGDAKKIACQLHNSGYQVIYSIAGLLRQPELPCEVICGGFSRFASCSVSGLEAFIRHQNIKLLLDCSHPYAQRISQSAVTASRHLQLPCLRYQRPAWQPGSEDNWISFKDWPDLLAKLAHYQRPFFTFGQTPLNHLHDRPDHQHWLIRSALDALIQPSKNITLIQAIGPYNLADEKSLLQQYNIDLLISKNSGGAATAAKLKAAAELNIPVLLQQRPEHSVADDCFTTIEQATEYCHRYLKPELS